MQPDADELDARTRTGPAVAASTTLIITSATFIPWPRAYDGHVGREARVSPPVRVERKRVAVMFACASEDTPAAIQRAWAEFERVVGLKGRKFFGAFDSGTHEYRVCARLEKDDDPTALGLDVGTLPGGIYLRARLQGEPPAVYEKIPSVFGDLVKEAAVDSSRPTIEFYRSRTVIDLLLPIS